MHTAQYRGIIPLNTGVSYHTELSSVRRYRPVGVGFLAQYLVKPLLGFAIAMMTAEEEEEGVSRTNKEEPMKKEKGRGTYSVGEIEATDWPSVLFRPNNELNGLSLTVLSHEYFPKFTDRIITLTPLIGVILTTLLCASPVSMRDSKFKLILVSFAYLNL
ncbi:hypothetical protein BHM03_00041454 [Ensete ventricosum]|nr:hypothetical protein BHM03_00041454 [Ensete ventricosum]